MVRRSCRHTTYDVEEASRQKLVVENWIPKIQVNFSLNVETCEEGGTSRGTRPLEGKEATIKRQPTVGFLPHNSRVARVERPEKSFYTAAVTWTRGTRAGMAGISVTRNPSTNIGRGATRPQRFKSQPARMKLISGTRVRSKTARVSPR